MNSSKSWKIPITKNSPFRPITVKRGSGFLAAAVVRMAVVVAVTGGLWASFPALAADMVGDVAL